MKVHIISLGCPKNLTDTEVIMGKLVSSGYEITLNPKEADIIIINTCAFLKSARDEVKQTVKEMRKHKKEIYLAGCFPKLLPKVKLPGVKGTINSLGLFDYHTPRVKATPPWFAYVKIAEGCNNKCTYCLIPKIRGRLKVRPVHDILSEVKLLVKKGVKEIVYVAQDTTAHPKLAEILQKTCKIKGISWIRIMYAHPKHLTDKIVEIMAQEKKIVKYLDLPIQHVCDKILTRMNRRYTRQDLEKLIAKIRGRIPKIALRTSVIVGFPGENEADFAELFDFIKLIKFDKLGVFGYCREKGTPAYYKRGQVAAQAKKSRVEKLMGLQARISKGKNKKLLGKTLETIIEGTGVGRTYRDAPEIDGQVFFSDPKSTTPGKIVRTHITGARVHDLIGALIDRT